MPFISKAFNGSFQSLAVSIQQGKQSDALGTLACILVNMESEELYQLGKQLERGVVIKHPAN